MTIREYLEGAGYHIPEKQYYNDVEKWLFWYKGEKTDFHKYSVYNGQSRTTQYRRRLYMAKQICEDWANLLMTENVSVIVSGTWQSRLDEILHKNNFQTRANQLVEITFASGAGAFVEYLGKNREPNIDYVRGGMIYPLTWDNGEVTECAFGSSRIINGKEACYLQIHIINNGKYTIQNVMFEVESGALLPLPDGMAGTISTGSDIPMFQIIKPNIVNNLFLDNPLGISIYANAMDILEGCDLVYDCYCTEFLLGRKRLLVPASAVQENTIAGLPPSFDPNDLVYQMVPDVAEQQIKEFNGALRAQDHEIAIKRNLSQLSAKCGLGYDRYQFDGVAPKTATEVISTRSDTYISKCKHQEVLRYAIVGMVRALAYLDGAAVGEITVEFDDSIITDRKADFAEYKELVSMGIMRPEELRSWYFNEDIDTAKKNMPESSALLE